MMLISLEYARRRLKPDTTDDDENIVDCIKGASAGVVRYLKSPNFADSNGDIPLDSNGVGIDVPEDIKAATVNWVGIMLRSPDNDVSREYDMEGAPPRSVRAMLYSYRVPTIGASPPRRCRWWEI